MNKVSLSKKIKKEKKIKSKGKSSKGNKGSKAKSKSKRKQKAPEIVLEIRMSFDAAVSLKLMRLPVIKLLSIKFQS